MIVVFTKYADDEIRETVSSYESLRLGISNKLLQEIREKSEQIASYPEAYQLVAKRLRRVELTTVPFQLYYSVRKENIPVLGFVPARMHPASKHRLIYGRLNEWKQNPVPAA